MTTVVMPPVVLLLSLCATGGGCAQNLEEGPAVSGICQPAAGSSLRDFSKWGIVSSGLQQCETWFFEAALAYKKKIGFIGTLIKPKSQETTKHQYDTIYFL
uniref:Uncharacterized protein n=1 Tax=Lactuca sativa TaxID=4236 RepID=A0A9R1UPB8_LACSA|nr:hypothetical protein LSAT_V11C800444490 [Lactuca sativa]